MRGSVHLLAGLLFLFLFSAKIGHAPAQPELGDNQALVVFGLETDDRKLKHELRWAPFDPAAQTYISKKGKRKKIDFVSGKSVSKEKRAGKTYKRFYSEVIEAGTYVLHSVSTKDGSLTTFHPLTVGFEARPGEVIYIGDFIITQRWDAFRSAIDPMAGVSLEMGGFDLTRTPFNANEPEDDDLSGLKGYIEERKPVYYLVGEYQ